jgi:hypothetical protein
VEARYHAERGELRLALAGKNVDLGTADGFRFGDEDLAVLGVSACRGRDHPELRDFQTVAQSTKAPQRRERLLDRVGSQQARRLHLASKPGEYLLVEDGCRATSEAFIGHEPYGIRADIDDRDRRPVIETTLRDIHGRATPLKSGRYGV